MKTRYMLSIGMLLTGITLLLDRFTKLPDFIYFLLLVIGIILIIVGMYFSKFKNKLHK